MPPQPRALALLLAGGLLASGLAGAAPASAQQPGAQQPGAQQPAVALQAGTTPQTRPFPDDAFTVADEEQATGRRVALPTEGCDLQGASLCQQLALLNTLDGFDVRPQVQLPFTAPVDLRTVTPQTVRVEGPGGFVTGLTQLVLDPTSARVSGLPVDQLEQGTTYTLVVGPGIRAADGSAVAVCAAGCRAGDTARRSSFTTRTTTAVLDRVRAALDDGSAYTAAGIAADARTLRFDTAADGGRSIFPTGIGVSTTPTAVTRDDQVGADPALPASFTSTPVPSTARPGSALYGFGSFDSPQYLRPDVTLPTTPTAQTASPTGRARLGVAVVSPAPGDSCIRPVVFGHGFTRSKYDVFLAAATLAQSNLALFATDVVGHGLGPASRWTVVTPDGESRTGAALGRGRDLDGDGTIASSEGSAGNPVLGSSDALVQTVIDNMALVRALERGVDLDGDGTADTCAGEGAVTYFGQSFGGIYGTMLLGVDPRVRAGVPNVPGGPVVELARQGLFRSTITQALGTSLPDRRNGGPGLGGFTEDFPLRRDPRVTDPRQGAVAIQDTLRRLVWAQRGGSPEAYAPRLRPGAQFGDKRVVVQVAWADGTVPNPATAEILRAGELYDRTWVYRNDRTANAPNNPHGFLLTPQLPAHLEGLEQIRRFLGEADERDPDTPDGRAWEPAVAKLGSAPTVDYRLQLDCLHYPDPQTGQPQTRSPQDAEQYCADRSAELAPARTATGTTYVPVPAQRVVDTREGTGAPAGPVSGRLTVDLTRSLPDAAATTAVLNVTALGAARSAHLTAFPTGPVVPGTSNLNLQPAVPGRTAGTQANQVTVRLDQYRRVDLQVVGGPAQVLVDVVGYTTARTTGARYELPTPSRLLDTRSTAQPLRSGPVVVDVAGGRSPAPTAVVLNVTATRADARGHVVASPTGSERPGTSNVNVEPGQTQANQVTVPVGEDGRVTLDVVNARAALVVDLLATLGPGDVGLELYPLPLPVRAGDTRGAAGGFGSGGPRSGEARLTLPEQVPAGAGVVLNVTALGASAPAFVTAYPAGTPRPETSNVNVVPGRVQANEVVTGVGADRQVSLHVGGAGSPRAHLVADVVGYLAPPAR
jgi:hypothetical protein